MGGKQTLGSRRPTAGPSPTPARRRSAPWRATARRATARRPTPSRITTSETTARRATASRATARQPTASRATAPGVMAPRTTLWSGRRLPLGRGLPDGTRRLGHPNARTATGTSPGTGSGAGPSRAYPVTRGLLRDPAPSPSRPACPGNPNHPRLHGRWGSGGADRAGLARSGAGSYGGRSTMIGSGKPADRRTRLRERRG